jgi:Uma2 family endonuclease
MSTVKEPAPGVGRATTADLAKVKSKAELINGRVVHLMPTGYLPNRIAFRIARSLDDHAETTRQGFASTENLGFVVPELSSGRESFSPDAAYYVGPLPENLMRFVSGAPTFATEVRSENDYGVAAEEAMAAKRADYFEAGTLVLWDVDPIARLIRKYVAKSPSRPTVFEVGDEADAEPAVPGWRILVDRVFS